MNNKISTLCFFVLILQAALYAERLVIIEQMSTTDCTSCVERSEYLYDILVSSQNKVTAIVYYKDLLKTDDGDTRCSYYGWGYYGMCKLNGRTPPGGIGQVYPDDIYHVDTTVVNTEYNKEANFVFMLNSILTGTSPNHSCSLTVRAKALKDYSSSGIIRMHVAVVENSVDYQQSTGSAPDNGQEVHHTVCRKMLPSGAGSYIGDQTTGQENIVRVTYTNDDAKQNFENIRIVSFIQDYSNKEIIGAFIFGGHPFRDLVTPVNDNIMNADNKKYFTIVKATARSFVINSPCKGQGSIKLYSADGRCCRDIMLRNVRKGNNIVHFCTGSLPGGLYIIALKINNHTMEKKLILPLNN